MDIVLKNLTPPEFEDHFWEVDYNGYVLPILWDGFCGEVATKSIDFYNRNIKKITETSKIESISQSFYYNPLFKGDKLTQKYVLDLYVQTGNFYKYLVYFIDKFDYKINNHNKSLSNLLSIVLRNSKNSPYNLDKKGYAKINNGYNSFSPNISSAINIFQIKSILSTAFNLKNEGNLIQSINLSNVKKFIGFYDGILIELSDGTILEYGNEPGKLDINNTSNGFNLRKYFEDQSKQNDIKNEL